MDKGEMPDSSRKGHSNSLKSSGDGKNDGGDGCTKDKFSILSFNILANAYIKDYFPEADPNFLKWENRKSYLIDYIKRFDCDILLFQEMQEGDMYDFFREELVSDGYESHFLKRAKAGKKDGVATFYKKGKFSSISHDEIKLKEYYGEVQGRVALISRFKTNDGNSINTINIHIDWVPKKMQQSEIRYDGFNQMKYLLERPDVDIKSGNWIICGDFNSDSESSIYRLCIRKGLIDAFAENPYNTSSTKYPRRIDFCFLSPGIKGHVAYDMKGLCRNDIVPSREMPSDHLALKVVVDVTGSQRTTDQQRR